MWKWIKSKLFPVYTATVSPTKAVVTIHLKKGYDPSGPLTLVKFNDNSWWVPSLMNGDPYLNSMDAEKVAEDWITQQFKDGWMVLSGIGIPTKYITKIEIKSSGSKTYTYGKEGVR